MRSVRALLLDLDSHNGWGKWIEEVLESYLEKPIQVSHESVRQSEFADVEERLSLILGRVSPEISLFLFDEFSRNLASRLLSISSKRSAGQPVIAITPANWPCEAQALLNSGACDFVIPPLQPVDLLARLLRWIPKERPEENGFMAELNGKIAPCKFIGASPLLIAELRKLDRFARSDAGVLITGESGTGKEIFAQAIHRLSTRAKRPFVSVNCASLSRELGANELFGHVSGAYTGATTASRGWVQAAEGGVLFLDELNSLPLGAQPILLRLVENREVQVVGSPKIEKANVRIIAATNRSLEEMVRDGTFRGDLSHRLSVLTLTPPPLRGRPEDVRLLAEHFVRKLSTSFGGASKELGSGAWEKLLRHNWPGNVRELEHVIEKAVVLSDEGVIGEAEIDIVSLRENSPEASFNEARARMLADWVKEEIHRRLIAANGNISEAARKGSQDPRVLRRMMRTHHIERPIPAGI